MGVLIGIIDLSFLQMKIDLFRSPLKREFWLSSAVKTAILAGSFGFE